MRTDVVEALVAPPYPGKSLCRAMGRTGHCTTKCGASSTSICRSWNGPRKRASPTSELRERSKGGRQDGAEGRNYGADIMRMSERSLLLQMLDQSWKEHLFSLDHLRQGINLRAYGQRDPLNEYKREAFELFQGMLGALRESVTSVLAHVELRGSGKKYKHCHGRI
jgi:preprotein translocase subunit SecA